MQKAKVPLTNFQFGEVSPSLISRTDTKVYNNSAQKIENFFLRAEGGVIKRAGMSKIYEFDTTTDKASFTITVADYANIVVGSQIKFMKSDGTIITIEFETAGGSSPSASVGNKHFVRSNEGNDTVADNLYTAINAISGFTVANPSAAVVTVTRDTPVNPTENLTVTSSDTTRLTVTDFNGKVRHYDSIAAHQVATLRDSGAYSDIGNDMKAANTDAFKVAINRLCNVADDVYRKAVLNIEQLDTLESLLLQTPTGIQRKVIKGIVDKEINPITFEATVLKLDSIISEQSKQTKGEKNG